MGLIVSNMEQTSSNLKTILLSGDWIPKELPAKIHDIFGNVEIISLGGATEASIWSIYYPIGEVDKNGRVFHMGIF